ncbi:HlyD family type I secretion periplasmic adaptor subunit [Sulfurovum sp.]|uniref:HlyD family type I secretion periplasmic adaptor subunit n=1 Tax=Sulfurovum sp. TaxID=1969726 RepID=UPI002867C2EE|nr:HlyD family type I secretion periplasmic adaptor subunit [Sulfurovum sp.]
MKPKLSKEDHEFVNSLSSAVAEHTPIRARWVLYFWVFTVFLFILWASLTQIDEITRGEGEVVPSGENQMVQNLEGGIVKKIYVKIGDTVEKGQKLLKIDNLKFEAQRGSTNIKELELKAKMIRLKAESQGKLFDVSDEIANTIPVFIQNERSLYESRQNQLNIKIAGLENKRTQKEQELKELTEKIIHLERMVLLIDEEVRMMEPMVEQGVKSKVTFMKLQREQSGVTEELGSAKNAIPRIEAGISETVNTIEEAKINFQNEAKEELNEVTAEVMRVKESFQALDDQVERTTIKSPIKGVVQKLFIQTIGGVIKPGEDIIEIVPTDEMLWIEVKIKPSDIAFVYPGQKAIVKFSAYDFAIYGSLEGEVVHISADTQKDKKENAFYTIHVKTKKNHLGTSEKPLKIIPGMTVNIDIMTGKKSVMDYILKPILKAKQYTFTER